MPVLAQGDTRIDNEGREEPNDVQTKNIVRARLCRSLTGTEQEGTEAVYKARLGSLLEELKSGHCMRPNETLEHSLLNPSPDYFKVKKETEVDVAVQMLPKPLGKTAVKKGRSAEGRLKNVGSLR